IDTRWMMLRELRDVLARTITKDGGTPGYVRNAPEADIFPIDVSFAALQDGAERDRLNQLPTSFHLPDEAVDHLRAAAATSVLGSEELRRALGGEWAGVDAPPR